MNIFKTFEIFLREPLSLLKERFVQIVNIQSNLFSQSRMNADLLDRKTQITIINSENMYSLCQTVLYKQRMQKELAVGLRVGLKDELPSNIQWALPQSKKQVVLGQLLKRE